MNETNERNRLALGAIAYIAGVLEGRTFKVQDQEFRLPREVAITVASVAYAASEEVLLGMNREQRRALAKQAIGE